MANKSPDIQTPTPKKTKLHQTINEKKTNVFKSPHQLQQNHSNTQYNKSKCKHCQQLYVKHMMNRHTKSGKCELYSKHIEFSPDVCTCKFCPLSKTKKENIHLLYKHLEAKHHLQISNNNSKRFQHRNQNVISAHRNSHDNHNDSTKTKHSAQNTYQTEMHLETVNIHHSDGEEKHNSDIGDTSNFPKEPTETPSSVNQLRTVIPTTEFQQNNSKIIPKDPTNKPTSGNQPVTVMPKTELQRNHENSLSINQESVVIATNSKLTTMTNISTSERQKKQPKTESLVSNTQHINSNSNAVSTRPSTGNQMHNQNSKTDNGNKTSKVKCRLCQQLFHPTHIQIHQKNCQLCSPKILKVGREFTCTDCPFTHPKMQDMFRHIKQKHINKRGYSKYIQQVPINNEKGSAKTMDNYLETTKISKENIPQTQRTSPRERNQKHQPTEHMDTCFIASTNINLPQNQCLTCKDKLNDTSKVLQHVKPCHSCIFSKPAIINIEGSYVQTQENSFLATPGFEKKLTNNQNPVVRQPKAKKSQELQEFRQNNQTGRLSHRKTDIIARISKKNAIMKIFRPKVELKSEPEIINIHSDVEEENNSDNAGSANSMTRVSNRVSPTQNSSHTNPRITITYQPNPTSQQNSRQAFQTVPPSQNTCALTNQTLPPSNHENSTDVKPSIRSLPQPISNIRSITKHEFMQPSQNKADTTEVQIFVKEPTPLSGYPCPLTMPDQQKPCPKYDSEWKVRQHIEYFHNITVGCQKKLHGIRIQKQIL